MMYKLTVVGYDNNFKEVKSQIVLRNTNRLLLESFLEVPSQFIEKIKSHIRECSKIAHVIFRVEPV